MNRRSILAFDFLGIDRKGQHKSAVEKDSPAQEDQLHSRYRFAIVLLIVSILFNAGALLGTYFGFQYVENRARNDTKTEHRPEASISGRSFAELDPWSSGASVFTLEENVSLGNDEVSKILGWKNTSLITDVDLTLNNTFRIKMPRTTAFYQVYVHIAFRSPSSGNSVPSNFIHKLQREGPKVQRQNEKEVINDQRTIMCSNDPKAICYNSIIFAVVRLRSSDELYIEANHKSAIDIKPQSTFFSIFRLD